MYKFETRAPLSRYLQTSGLDMPTAYSATTKFKEQTRTFHSVHSKALEFVTTCNDKISKINMDENQTVEIDALETALLVKG